MKPFAYRVFDLRDRFDEPFMTVLDALNALYSDRAYMAEGSGEIVAYYPDNKKLKIPCEFFIVSKPRFESEKEATAWLTERNRNITESGKGFAMGIAVANPKDSFEKQLADAMSFKDVELNIDKPLEAIADEIERWLVNSRNLV